MMRRQCDSDAAVPGREGRKEGVRVEGLPLPRKIFLIPPAGKWKKWESAIHPPDCDSGASVVGDLRVAAAEPGAMPILAQHTCLCFHSVPALLC